VVAEPWPVRAGELSGDQMAGFENSIDDRGKELLRVWRHGISL
jgi:hypothetical protein